MEKLAAFVRSTKARVVMFLAGLAVASVAMAQVYYGYNPSTGLEAFHGTELSGGTQPTLSGCATISASAGGAFAGKFATSGTSCNLTITFPSAAPNGWICLANDLTTPADKLSQSASTTTSCSFTGTTVAADVINWRATGY